MPASVVLVAAVLWAGPDPQSERGMVEVGVAAEVLYPPAIKEPKKHLTYGVAASAAILAGERFKALIGLGFDHVVHGWLGEPGRPRPAEREPFTGTVPVSYRGELFRITPLVRVGLQNEIAYGYAGVSPGYALRIASLQCAAPPCTTTRSIDSGLNLGISLGAMFAPTKYGLVVGAEVGLDWAWFRDGHPGLAVWSQGMSARLVGGWRF